MFQLYLLTVLTNILAGMALASGFLSERFERFSEYSSFMENRVYRIILGAVSLVIGIINLFSTYEGNTAFIGDLLPSLAGITTGILLIAEFFSTKEEDDEANKASEIAEKVGSFSGPYLTIVGVSSVVVGVLHGVLNQIPVF